MEEEIAHNQGHGRRRPPSAWNPDEVELKLNKDEIKFEDTTGWESRVAEVKEVSKVEGSDQVAPIHSIGDARVIKSSQNCQILTIEVTRRSNGYGFRSPQDDEKYVGQGMITLSWEHELITLLTVDQRQAEVVGKNLENIQKCLWIISSVYIGRSAYPIMGKIGDFK